ATADASAPPCSPPASTAAAHAQAWAGVCRPSAFGTGRATGLTLHGPQALRPGLKCGGLGLGNPARGGSHASRPPPRLPLHARARRPVHNATALPPLSPSVSPPPLCDHAFSRSARTLP